MTPNQREIIAARSTITSKMEYLSSTAGRLNTNTITPVPTGTTNFNTGQVTVASTATQIIAANATRTTVTVVNLSTTDIFVGTAAVTTTTGQLLLGTKGSAITIGAIGAVYAIVATGTTTISYEEESN